MSNRFTFCLRPMVLHIVVCFSAGATAALAEERTATVIDAQESGESAGKTFNFTLHQTTYSISVRGVGKRFGPTGTQNMFSLEPGLDRLKLVEFSGDPIFIYEVHDEDGYGVVTRLASRSLTAKWRTTLPGFNVGAAIANGRWLYVTCIGFVGKLDQETGKYSWSRSDLYDRGAFNSFDSLSFDRGKLICIGSAGEHIILDAASGKTLSDPD